ncbi:MAG TPA: PIN domain-containing protein [Terriglobales bacterium]|nr:PIN domain-containing protein [Terriglobales bacterium]
MTILVDTDILIEVARGRNAEILAEWARLGSSEDLVIYSPVTAAELWAGVRTPEEPLLSSLLASLLCIAIDANIGRRAGDYLRLFAKSHALELGDALIAATAALQGAALWTRTRKHYPMKDLPFYSP